MILDEIVKKKKLRLIKLKEEVPLKDIKRQAIKIVENENNYTNIFKEYLKKEDLSVIGEFKKASPSKGVIKENFKINEILEFYNKVGVGGFSILTEEDYFLGSTSYLKEIRKLSTTPILRKDFVIDFYQIYESKVIGANGILLIVSILQDSLLGFYNEAKKMNLQPLVEVHNKAELDLALKCNCDVIGINNRDLKTFKISLDTTKNLIKYIPKDKVVVCESGIMTFKDLKEIKNYGVDAVLIGEFFMKNINNEEFIDEYKRCIKQRKL